MRLLVNGESHEVAVDAERTLLSVLRHELGLTGAKYGCGEGNCGACTVEGLAAGDDLHPVQAAFVEHTAFQCAYCTPGFIMSTVALLARNPNPDERQIRAALSGHICRCGTYVRILRAVETAAEQLRETNEARR